MAGLDDDDEKGVRTPHTLGGPQEMAIVNECRPFSLILASFANLIYQRLTSKWLPKFYRRHPSLFGTIR